MVPEPTTHRYRPGDVVPGRSLTTIADEPVAVPDPERLVHLQFRRFASCPICNVHLRTFARRHDELLAAGVREVAVFHSDVAAMLPHQAELPFASIADPDYQLYDEFGVEFSLRAVLDPRAWTAPLKPAAWTVGFREARSPGGRFFSLRGQTVRGMPAELLIGPDGVVLASKYGRHANDQWSVDDVLELAVRATRSGSRTT